MARFAHMPAFERRRIRLMPGRQQA